MTDETRETRPIRAFIAPWPLTGAARAVPLLARAYLAIVFWYHGWGKMLDPGGWTEGRIEAGVPVWLAWIAVFAESVGSVLMGLGAFVRFAAALLIAQMIGAVYLVHWENGLFGQGGWEFNLGLMVISAIVLILGAGPLSIDSILASRRAHAVER